MRKAFSTAAVVLGLFGLLAPAAATAPNSQVASLTIRLIGRAGSLKVIRDRPPRGPTKGDVYAAASVLRNAVKQFRENWNRLGATFTTSLDDYNDWESVCIAFESMENENRLMDEGDPRAFNEDRLNRVRERDLMGALEVLQRLQTPLHRRLRRDVRMRRLDADFYLARERLTKRD